MKLSTLRNYSTHYEGILDLNSHDAIVLGLNADAKVVHKFGRNADVDQNSVPEDMWDGGGVYTGFPDVAQTMQVFSTSANDAAAGTGARTVQLEGLDENWNEQTETLTLNGTTPVTGTRLWRRMNRMTVQTSGSSNTAFNAGTITARHSTTTTNVFGVMPIGRNRTQVCAFTIPEGFTGLVDRVEARVDRTATGGALIGLYVREQGKAPVIRGLLSVNQSDADVTQFPTVLPLPARTDVTLRVLTVSANDLPLIASMDINYFRD